MSKLETSQLPSQRALSGYLAENGLTLDGPREFHIVDLGDNVDSSSLPSERDRQEVNSQADTYNPGRLQRFLSGRTAKILMPAGVAGAAAFGFGFGGEAHASNVEADGMLPPPVIESVDSVDTADTFDVQGGGDNPNYIPNEDEPNPAGPPVVPDDGDPNNDPPLTPAPVEPHATATPVPTPPPTPEPTHTPSPTPEPTHTPSPTPVPTPEPTPPPTPEPTHTPPPPIPHMETFQLVVKKLFDANRNSQIDTGDIPLDQEVMAWIDEDRNGKLDGNEGVMGFRTGPDGVEIVTFTVNGNAEGLNVCVEEVNVAEEFEAVIGAGCDTVDPNSRIAEVQLLNRNKLGEPKPSATPVKTPAPTKTPEPTRPPQPTEAPRLGGPTPEPQPEPEFCLPEHGGGPMPPGLENATEAEIAIKCEVDAHSKESHEEHVEILEGVNEIKDAVGLGEGEMPIDEQIGVKPGEDSIAERVDDLTGDVADLTDIVNNLDVDGDDLPLWKLLLTGGIGGGVAGIIVGGINWARGRREEDWEEEEVEEIDEGPDGGNGQGPQPQGGPNGENGAVAEAVAAEDEAETPAPAPANGDGGPEAEAGVVHAQMVEKDGRRIMQISEDQFDQLFRLFTAGIDKLSDQDLEELVTPQLRQVLADLNIITTEQAIAMSAREIAEAAKPLAKPILDFAAAHPDKVRELRGKAKGVDETGKAAVNKGVPANNGAPREDAPPAVEVNNDKRGADVLEEEQPEVGPNAPEGVTVAAIELAEGKTVTVSVGQTFTNAHGTVYAISQISQDARHFILRNTAQHSDVTFTLGKLKALVREDRDNKTKIVKTEREARVKRAQATA